MTDTSQTAAPLPECVTRGHCVACGTPIVSATARYCMNCFRSCAADCYECLKDGRLKKAYRPYRERGKDGKMSNLIQKKCAVCNNRRLVFTRGPDA
jgi:hypothetical protein